MADSWKRDRWLLKNGWYPKSAALVPLASRGRRMLWYCAPHSLFVWWGRIWHFKKYNHWFEQFPPDFRTLPSPISHVTYEHFSKSEKNQRNSRDICKHQRNQSRYKTNRKLTHFRSIRLAIAKTNCLVFGGHIHRPHAFLISPGGWSPRRGADCKCAEMGIPK